jgi:hypothetical protein
MGSKESLQYNRFEIYPNEGNNSVDIRAGTPRIEYRESVFTPFVQISVFVIETGSAVGEVTALEGLTLQGTEKVLFEIEDANGNKITLDDPNDLRVGSVANVSQSFKNISYSLNVISKEMYDNTLLDTRVRRRLEGKISDIVSSIVKDDLGSDKAVYVDKTHNSYFGDGGDQAPFNRILELQSLSIPDGRASKSAGYLFWETSDGYHFRSLDEMFKYSGSRLNYVDSRGEKIKNYIENKLAEIKIPDGYNDKILYSRIDRTIDALSQFESGAFGTVLELFDDVTKEYTKSGVKSPPPEGTAEIAGEKLPQFSEEYANKATDRIVAKRNTGGSFGSNDSLERQVEKITEEDIVAEEILWQAKQNFRQKFNMSAEIIIPADFSLHAGDLVHCDFPEISTKKTLQESQKDSGIYMIADLCHYGDKSQSYTGLHLVRDSFGIK